MIQGHQYALVSIETNDWHTVLVSHQSLQYTPSNIFYSNFIRIGLLILLLQEKIPFFVPHSEITEWNFIIFGMIEDYIQVHVHKNLIKFTV